MKVKVFLYNIYLDILSFFRLKVAVFFSILFPLLLFIVFSAIWTSDNPNYIGFILPGLFVLMGMSEGLFSIGPVIKEFYSSGRIRYMKFMPVDISYFFISFLLGRMMFFIISILLLLLLSHFIYDFNVWQEMPIYLIGSISSLVIFSLLGLCVSFLSKKDSGKTLTNIVYFILMFVGDIFYSMTGAHPILKFIKNLLPTTHLLSYMRHENFSTTILLIWFISLAIVFRLLIHNLKIPRTI
ncbi:ABC transporter permease [Sphingobacterium sp. UT-1RO-CII-1]|uniref:ABC transporter permease n=1 Tax=Sphingobacterium sp. UT-1RO-CII-1 TaxID=2995225 RepID=UPI00227D659E|nr:ABC transporter permease [Sphingobacterium sp. UT-1RO-CII-1]MCY4779277.1 ABC transporter permease [Sphingobacterium sp. UT-1RO-CII-1]